MENQIDVDAVINNLAQKIGALTVENAVLQYQVQSLVARIEGENKESDSGSDFA